MFLTSEEVAELTGWKTWKKQVVGLTAMGFTFKIQPVGRPIVLRAHVEEMLGGKPSLTATSPEPVTPWQPDWEAFERSEREVQERKAAGKANAERKRAEKEARRLAREKAPQDKLQQSADQAP